MQRKASTIAIAVLLLATALPAVGNAAEGRGPRVVALQVRVQDTNTGDVLFVPIDERIRLESDRRYRISLVGADRLNDREGDIGVNARFAEDANRGAISLGNSGGNWVIVEPTNRANGNAALSYVVQGNYDMPAAWRTGRIRFDLDRLGSGGSGGQGNAQGLAAKVEDLATGRVQYYELERGNRIPIGDGERLRITLVDRYRGTDRAVNADFDSAARGGVDIERTGPNWVIVRGEDDSGNAHLTFEPESSRYADGRIRFELADRVGGGYPDDGNVSDRARWRRSEELATRLYRAILQEEPRSSRDSVQLIYDRGIDGLRQVARELANEGRERGVFNDRRASEVVGELYRELLGRRASNDELYRTDRGFRQNVDKMGDRGGILIIVDGIVTSDEFRRAQNLDEYGLTRSARY